MTLQKEHEGTIPFHVPGIPVCHTWYKVIGDLTSLTPLIMLHGGPGAGHGDSISLGQPLAKAGVPVLFYDQIGCGESSRVVEKANEPGFWSFDLFCAELDNIVDHFGLRERGFHVHGHSWGGMLASTYAARRPRGLCRLIISSSNASAKLYASEAERAFRLLPVSESVLQMDADGKFDEPEYQEAGVRFMKRHFCLLDPWPGVLEQSGKCCETCTMSELMCGRSKIRLTGTLKDWDAATHAALIAARTLLLSGSFDWRHPKATKPWFDAIPIVEWVTLEHSSHMAHLEEPERYLELLKRVLLQQHDEDKQDLTA